MVQKVMETVWSVERYWLEVLLLKLLCVSRYGVKCGTSLRFSENKWWVNSIDPHGWFQW